MCMRLMEEYSHCQPSHDLNSFNNSMVQLIELINANLNDPNGDMQELARLQAKVDDMRSTVQNMIKAKSEKIVEEVIPNYFSNLYAHSTPSHSSDERKRKLVTFNPEVNSTEPVSLEQQAESSSFDNYDEIDSMVNEDMNSIIYIPSDVSQHPYAESEGSCSGESNVAMPYQSYYAHQQQQQELMMKNTTSVPLSLDFDHHSNTVDNHLRGGGWVEYEEIFLKELVSRHKSGAKGKRVVDWSSVARELHRNELDCKVKWNALCNAARTRKGPYKVEEDQLIMTKVTEYLNSSSSSSSSGSANRDVCLCSDLWEGLEKTMGRPAKNIRLRWKITLSKRVPSPAAAASK